MLTPEAPTQRDPRQQPDRLPESILKNSIAIGENFRVSHDGSTESRVSASEITRRIGLKTHCSNNGTVAFITPEGQLRVAPWSRELGLALQEASYSQASFFVPLSNGELPADPTARAEWKRALQDAAALKNAQLQESREQGFEAKAVECGIAFSIAEHAVFKGKILSTDGLHYKVTSTGPTHRLSDRFEDSNREQSVGRYDRNNGRLAFVDEKGRAYVVASTTANISTLEGASYRQGSMFVPFSNAEIPVEDRSLQTLRRITTHS